MEDSNRENQDASPNRREFLGAVSAAALLGFDVQTTFAETGITENNLDFLKKYSTSLLESAIYLLKGTHDGITLTRPGLLRQTDASETLVGYAVTSVFSTDADDARGRRDNPDYWNYVFEETGPKIAVSVDASRSAGTGSSWGQQNAHIHKGLGCRGVLTNGGVRDIKVFREIGLEVFSASLTAAHGNPHFVEFGKTVALNGAKINSGDVVCADEHGAIVVPREYLPVIEQAAAETARRVSLVAEYSRRKDFSPAGLADVIKKLRPTTPWRPTR
ncbi:MAG TPA: RraA family protein [Pyrinomonadaceae bacterium]|jgi:regulator of RNase E activity RraA